MAKKKSIDFGKIAAMLSVLLGIVAIIMMFVPSVAIKDSESTYTGLQVTFGHKKNDVTYFDFSFMNMLTYILVLVGILFAMLSILGKGSKFAAFISAAAFLVAGIFFFCEVAFCVPNKDMEGIISGIAGIFGEKASIKDSLTLGAGAIVGGIVSLLSTLGMGYKAFAK